MTTDRIVIVGGGIAGLATAWHLVRGGARDVVVVERERSLGTQSTAQNAGIVRTAIDDAPIRALARRGAEFLVAPPAGFADRPLVRGDGLIVLTSAAPPWDDGAPGIERVDAARVRSLFPPLGEGARSGYLFAHEGRVDVPALLAAFERGARQGGARFELGARVAGLLPEARGVELADGRRIEAHTVVIAAGAWAGPLGRAVGSRIELTPTRRHLLVTQRDPEIDPHWPVLWSDDDEFYARPESGGWMLCACDGDAIDPDHLAASGTVLESVHAKSHAVLRRARLAPAARFWAGSRTHASDKRFVLGPDPDVAGLVWAAGLGGHGITCAAAVGEVVAAAVLGAEMPAELARACSPARFASRDRTGVG